MSRPIVVEAICRRRELPDSQEKAWFAEYKIGGRTEFLPIDSTDAWNFDIEAGLPVRIRISGETCTIKARLRNNKQYVQISKNVSKSKKSPVLTR